MAPTPAPAAPRRLLRTLSLSWAPRLPSQPGAEPDSPTSSPEIELDLLGPQHGEQALDDRCCTRITSLDPVIFTNNHAHTTNALAVTSPRTVSQAQAERLSHQCHLRRIFLINGFRVREHWVPAPEQEDEVAAGSRSSVRLEGLLELKGGGIDFKSARAPRVLITACSHRRQAAASQPATMPRRSIPSTAARTLRRYASTSGNPADLNSPSRQNLRRVVLTGAVTLITVVGAITGASLKGDKDAVKQKHKVQEMPIAERIAMIDARRAELLRTKADLDRKLDRLQARMSGDAVAKEGGQQRD